MRVGIGYDVHAYGTGDHVMLGGVRVPHSQGVQAHSDGDVLLLALAASGLNGQSFAFVGSAASDSRA